MDRPTLTAEITLPLSQIEVEVIPTAAVATAPSAPTIAVSLKFKTVNIICSMIVGQASFKMVVRGVLPKVKTLTDCFAIVSSIFCKFF